MRADRALRAGLGIACCLAVLAGCTPSTPPPSPSASPTARPFTVLAAGPIRSLDPAVATGTAESILVSSVYQRLMEVESATGDLKPDAATDCAFTSRLVYECTLPTTLTFTNGDPLTATDVRFSIQRVLRFDLAGTSVSLLSSLSRIETPDAYTVRFVLSREDNQFGWALASQAASIVDHNLYDPDTALALDTFPVGSGPYQVLSVNATGAQLVKFGKYVGPLTGAVDAISLTVADSVAAEDAVAKDSADVIWDCLDNAAQQRIQNELTTSGGKTAAGFTRVDLPGVRVTRLYWNPSSPFRSREKLRDGVARALQPSRTLDSVVPVGVAEHVKAFPVGGRPKLPALSGRTHLTLGYDSSDPTQSETAELLRDKIEDLDGVSVRLSTDRTSDLLLTSRPAWINNAVGWLQLYLGAPLPASKAKLAELDTHARASTGTARTADLSELQLQAATDGTVLPVSQTAGLLLLGPGIKISTNAFGGGQQLGLWGLSRG